ncbi:MAG: HAD family hydrolase [Balneolaceae bacterium]|nr:HAD family hydrolase [Balneolaceae bacterium]
MMKSLLCEIDALFLDMNSTFMFEEDNFGDDQDFYATYREIGGDLLQQDMVNAIIRATYHGMEGLYQDPAYYEQFPSVLQSIPAFSSKTKNLSDVELERLTDVFAIHELGTIPDTYASFVIKLSYHFTLALVANIWAPKHHWVAEFKRVNLHTAFEALIFSSDYSFMKPSPKIYQQGLSACNTRDTSRAAFIGDSLTYDMQGAKELGFQTIWINEEAFLNEQKPDAVDVVIPNLLCLKECLLLINESTS